MNIATPVRNGNYMHTSNGKKYWPLDPRSAEVHIEVIAHHLATRARYNGATQHPVYKDRIFYSVAEHSVYVSYIGPPETALERLLHDASEAYNGDLIRPLKYDPLFSRPFKIVEELNEEVIAKRFDLIYPFTPDVKIADEAVTAAEVDQIILKDSEEEWISGRLHDVKKVAPFEIRMISPYPALKLFLHRFHQLWNAEKNCRRTPRHGEKSFGCLTI